MRDRTTDGTSRVAAPGSTPGLEVARVRWSVAGRLIVDDVDCTAPPGAFTGLLGPNGSGKSSLLRLVAGITVPDAGTAAFAGTDLASVRRRERARRVAFVEQEAAAETPLRVLDAVLLGRIPHRSLLAGDTDADRHLAREALARVGMAEFADRSLATLSGGERQRVHVARALAQEPSLLLLDEPTNHLDVAAQLATMTLARKLAADGVTVLAALHDLNLAAAACDHVVMLDAGRVVAAGSVKEVLVPAVIEQVYGVRCDVLEHPATGRPVLAFS
ncbi:iron complex transport system ATP-binding protein [Sediminihabitans luteus]|uniref:Iron complex transport system ATP-binding protein n=1 Tax=Sediminihabitans luteus TaxID=1138585 RepID=A0A2M9CY52_9CELL|nr:putative F420-0 ABC transporter ATP-binding protein [Sediminihabitans luteus]PJJ76805.1 iron complex transport system ATP-binding protein [Sediminihabitans luteus]GIJ00283.1 ABC transporter ATP-binding protein [Sediminihabitans luteus]